MPSRVHSYEQLTHRYLACKALEGLRISYLPAHEEFRRYAHCDDCTIFHRGCNPQESGVYRRFEDTSKLPKGICTECKKGVCEVDMSPQADYDPPGSHCVRRRRGVCEIQYVGDDLVLGASEEDADVIEARGHSGLRIPSYMEHFWNPDISLDFGFMGDINFVLKVRERVLKDCGGELGCVQLSGSYLRAQTLWSEAVARYSADPQQAYYILGRVAHILMDLTVPAHVHGDAHPGSFGRLFVGSCVGDNCGAGDTDPFEKTLRSQAVLQKSYDSINVRPYAAELLLADRSDFSWYALSDNRITEPLLFRLFWYTTQFTQYFSSSGDPAIELTDACDPIGACRAFASGDEGTYQTFLSPNETRSFDPALMNLLIQFTPCTLNFRRPKFSIVKTVADVLVPHALYVVAGLYRLFWDSTHDADNDGVGDIRDCNDSNPTVYPGAPEICGNGQNDDCDEFEADCDDPNCLGTEACAPVVPTFLITHKPKDELGNLAQCHANYGTPASSFPDRFCPRPHFFKDIFVGSIVMATTLTITPQNGFADPVTIRVVGFKEDNERNTDDCPDATDDQGNLIVEPPCADGIGEGEMQDSEDVLQTNKLRYYFGGVRRRSITVPAGSGVQFYARKNAIASGRYIIYLEATGGGITRTNEMLLVVDEDVPGYGEN